MQYEKDFPKNIPAQSDNVFLPSLKEEVGPIQSANERVSDLYRMMDVNKNMKDPGIWGRAGQFTTRASLGMGAGMAAAEMTDADRSKAAALGGLGGLVFLNPRSAGVMGNVLGLMSEGAPHALRGVDAYDSSPLGDKKKKKVRRKEPTK
jgi:hypothetical protein